MSYELLSSLSVYVRYKELNANGSYHMAFVRTEDMFYFLFNEL